MKRHPNILVAEFIAFVVNTYLNNLCIYQLFKFKHFKLKNICCLQSYLISLQLPNLLGDRDLHLSTLIFQSVIFFLEKLDFL